MFEKFEKNVCAAIPGRTSIQFPHIIIFKILLLPNETFACIREKTQTRKYETKTQVLEDSVKTNRKIQMDKYFLGQSSDRSSP